MTNLSTIDRSTFKSLIYISIVIILIIILAIIGIFNTSGRFNRLAQADDYVNGAGKLEQNYQTLMSQFFELIKVEKGLDVDSVTSSYNTRISNIVGHLKKSELELLSIKYGKVANAQDVAYLPVTFELLGNFQSTLSFIEFIENEIQVMGFEKLEISTSGASDNNLVINCVINFYELKS